jgi:hypothetical protein
MEDEKPKLTFPRTQLREVVNDLEKHAGTVPGPVPKTHDDFLKVQHVARRHHPEHFKE